jgi:heterodisulfide reductase subunit C
MPDFGYTINADRQIDLDANDTIVLARVRRREPSIDLCIGCGTCSATCTTGQFTRFNIRKIHTLLTRGEVISLKKEIARCMLCGKCQLVCPRGVNIRNLVQSILEALER